MMPLGTPTEVTALRLRLWDSGFRPVPIYNPDSDHPSPGKAPMGERWGDEARADPPAGTKPAHPAALNSGILCDGLRAIDIDIDNPTIAASIKARALDMFGEAPMRYRQNSPRVLLLYRAAEGEPPKRSIAGDMGKVEVLGRGQQFVAFGVHPSGADLHWMPEAPGDVDLASLTALTEAQIDAFLAAVAPSVGAKVPTHQTTSPRASQRGQGADGLQVVAALSAIPNDGPKDWEAWNRIGMATWAATSGSRAGLAAFHAWSEQHPSYSADETDARWEHYFTSPPTSIGAGTLFYLARGVQRSLDDAPADFVDDPGYPAEEQLPVEGRPVVPPTRSPLPLEFFADMKMSTEVADFVEGLLIEAAMSVVYGQSNSGKTFWLLHLALCVAAGVPWNGREVSQGPVIWLAMEGAYGIRNRVEAWKRHHGMEDANVPFAVVPVALDLLNPEAAIQDLIATIEFVAAKFEAPVKLTVVDTLSRAISGGNENSPEDMGLLVTNGTKIQQVTKSHLAWIHHSGKDDAKGARGHSLLRAATDTEIEITAEGAQRMARVSKQRELDCAGEFGFTLKVIHLGDNKRGKPVTSCVVEGLDEGHTAGAVLAPRLKGHVRRALDVLHDLLAESGKGGFPGVPSGVPSIPEEWWRQRFYDRTVNDGKDDVTQDGKRKAFIRSAQELQDKRLVGVNKGRVWAIRPGQNPGHETGQEDG